MQSKIVGNTISLLISKLIPSLLLTLINIIYSRYLSKADYGYYQTIWTYLNIFVIISTFGLPRYILSFGSLFQYSFPLKFKILFRVFILTIIPIALYLYFQDGTFSVVKLGLFITLLVLQSLYLIQEANTLSLEANKVLVISNMVYALALFLLHLLLLKIGYTIDLCLIFLILASSLRNVLVRITLNKFITSISLLPSFKEINQLFWFGINDTLQILTKWIDKIILILLLSSADYAVYFNGTYEIPLIGMGLSAFQTIITTQSAKPDATAESNIQLFNTSALFMSGILFPLFSFCFLFSNEIITILFGNSYSGSTVLFAITSLLIPMRICNYTVLLQLKSKGNIIFIGSIIDFVVALVLMIGFYPVWGLKGLALAIVLATYIQAAFYLYFIVKEYKSSLQVVLPWLKLIIRFLLIVTAFLFLKLLVKSLPGSFQLISGAILFSSIVFLFSYKYLNINRLD